MKNQKSAIGKNGTSLVLLLAGLLLTGPLQADNPIFPGTAMEGFSAYAGLSYSFAEYNYDPDVLDTIARVEFGRSFLASSTEYDNYARVAALENTSKSRMRREEYQLRLGIKKKILDVPWLTVKAGVNFGSGQEQCLLNCFELTRVAFLQYLQTSPVEAGRLLTYSVLFPLAVPSIDSLQDWSNEIGYTYFMIEGGAELHPYHDSNIDPYIGLEVGLGTCSIDVKFKGDCNTYKYGPTLGVQYHYTENLYFFTQADYTVQTFRIVDSATDSEGNSETIVLKFPDYKKTTITFGIGYSFH